MVMLAEGEIEFLPHPLPLATCISEVLQFVKKEFCFRVPVPLVTDERDVNESVGVAVPSWFFWWLLEGDMDMDEDVKDDGWGVMPRCELWRKLINCVLFCLFQLPF